MVKQYRKRPVVIEAVQWLGGNTNEMREFMGDYPKVVDRRIRIKTLEGTLYANELDFIIKGIHGEFYPCKPDIFAKTYEEVSGA